jgi:hypothetical protein
MAALITSSNGGFVQAVALPITGKTTNITSAVGNAASATALAEGLYRIYSPIDAHICAGDTADVNDMMLPAGSVEYFHFDGTKKLAAFCAAAGSVISATLV